MGADTVDALVFKKGSHGILIVNLEITDVNCAEDDTGPPSTVNTSIVFSARNTKFTRRLLVFRWLAY